MLDYNKIKEWFTERWQIVVAFFGLVFGALTLYLRSKGQKEILKNANEAHKKELDVNDAAEERLVEGIEEIKNIERDSLEAATKENDDKAKRVQEKKKEFVKKATTDEKLAEKIADKLGVDFVE